MAFHVACPITFRRICYCDIGFPGELRSGRSRGEILEEVARVQEFLADPWIVKAGRDDTVQVAVPRVETPVAVVVVEEDGGGDGEVVAGGAASASAKSSALRRQAAAEDYVREMKAGIDSDVLGEVVSDPAREAQGSSAVKIICQICFSGEYEGSRRTIKMLSCKLCQKKYHRSCLKIWAEYRDLFHWSSWTCPSCRICEVCRKAGDPTKLMYCKRCDDAYHSYCLQPPHKNVSHGPYLCPKHTRCHSCGSNVSGSGHSTRWFLSYTCCDACGRLFVKGKYCPVCLKVYRDSELTPMVCCDVCQQWVHCICDDISNKKYQQFQTDRKLSYTCPACRGDCYQVKDMDDAVQELWRRRDKADCNLILCLRSVAGLPIMEESISPHSDDDEDGPVLMKNDYESSLKFSFKSLTDKTSKSSKEYMKKLPQSLSNKKYAKKGYQLQFDDITEVPIPNIEKKHEARSLESGFKDQMNAHAKEWRRDGQGMLSSPSNRSPDNGKIKPSVDKHETRSSVKEAAVNNVSQVSKVHVKSSKTKALHVMLSSPNNRSPDNEKIKPSVDQQETRIRIEEAAVNNVSKVSKVHVKGSKTKALHSKEGAKDTTKNETSKGTKLVIHFGAKNRNITASPMSVASSGHRDQDISATNCSGDAGQQKKDGSKVEAHGDIGIIVPRGSTRVNKVRKLRKVSDIHRKDRANVVTETTNAVGHVSPVSLRQKRTETEEALPTKHSLAPSVNVRRQISDASELFTTDSSDDPKPLLKLKFKKPYFDQQNSLVAQGVEEKDIVKGQRSKRKRQSIEKLVGNWEDEGYKQLHEEKSIDEIMDANWILRKLGMDAIGKRVEVHQASDNSWHNGEVTDIIKGTDSLLVRLDEGRFMTVDLEKQGVRFVAKKRKRTKAAKS